MNNNLIDIEQLLQFPGMRNLILDLAKLDIDVRFVGGCVRDLLRKAKIKDIDLCTASKPYHIMKSLSAIGYKVIPTGIEHGTVTIVTKEPNTDGRPFTVEVTSLRNDVRTDGRFAEISFTNSYEEDAKRRDFTFNAMSLDTSGKLYDYFGGLQDLQNSRVKFVGDANKRIEEDYLRILRFFRFVSLFPLPEIDQDQIEAVKANLKGLEILSKERIRDEILKIMNTHSKGFIPTLRLMSQTTVFTHIGLIQDIGTLLEFIESSFTQYIGEVSDISLLALLVTHISSCQKDFALSKTQYNYIFKLHEIIKDEIDSNLIKELIRKEGYEFTKQCYLIYVLNKRILVSQEIITLINDFVAKEFPLKGKDLVDIGFNSDKELGKALKEAERIWVKSDYSLDKSQLLAMLKNSSL